MGISRTHIAIVLVVAMSATTCDFSGVVASPSDPPAGPTEGSAAGVMSFKILASDNSGLTQDYEALIADSGIVSLFISQSTVASETELEARVELSAGATIEPDPRTARSYADPVVYRVTSYDRTATREYTVVRQQREADADARIASLVFSASHAENTELVSDITGVVSGTTIAVALPYQLMIGETLELEPTITIPSGATISPTGAQDFRRPVIYTVTAATGVRATYVVAASVDMHTLTSFTTTRPFVIQSDGTKQVIADTDGSGTGASRTISMLPLLYDGTTGRPVGFESYEVPANATSDASIVTLGRVPPYDVTVTSANGEWSQVYRIDTARYLPFQTGIAASRIRVAPAFGATDSVSSVHAVSVAEFIYYRPRQLFSDWCVYVKYPGFSKNLGSPYKYQFSHNINYHRTSLSSDDLGSCMILTTFSDSLLYDRTMTLSFSNISSSNSTFAPPNRSYTVVGSYRWITIPASTMTYRNVHSELMASSSVTANSGWQPVTASHNYYNYSQPVTISDHVSYTKTTSYANAGYNQLHSWEITLDPYAMVDRIIDGPITTGNTVTTSGVTRTITFTLESTNARKVVGTVGTVYVKAESGATETHVLAINN